MTERKFDWKPNPDAQSKRFTLDKLGVIDSDREARDWSVYGLMLDQGEEGACVGHGVTYAVCSSPNRVKLPNPQATAFGMYYGSRRIDEWPGEDYDGTSVNAGMKLAREIGLINDWYWVYNADEMATAILEVGPVVLGIWWYESMYNTRDDGLVEVSGIPVGGHCIYVYGFDRDFTVGDYTGPVFKWKNSWGTEYGAMRNGVRTGWGYVPYDMMAGFLANEGEAAVPRK
jgi:hypothetical protein